MKNLPQEIYLQFGCTTEEMKDADFNEVAKGGAVSWCADKQFETDVRYVLAAEAEPPLSEEDIESAGWKLPSYHNKNEVNISPTIYYHPTCGTTSLTRNKHNNTISISIEGVASFIGHIPNRTALKLLMGMLGIKVGA